MIQDLHIDFYLIVRLVLIVLAIALVYRLLKQLAYTYRTRQHYWDIPCLPRNWLLGHLINAGEKLSPGINRHPDYGFLEIWEELGQPPAFLTDFALIDRPMLVVMHPDIAEAVSQSTARWKYSIPKSDTVQAYTPLVGKHSLVVLEGEEWKTIRKRFNKGFAPAHLNTLTSLVVSKTKIFLERIKQYAEQGDAFTLKEPTSDLTIDIITQLTIERDFQAQTAPEGQGAKSTFGILTAIKTMSGLMERTGQGIDIWNYVNVVRLAKSRLYEALYDRAILNEIVSKLPNKTKTSVADSKTTSQDTNAIVHLSLAGLEPTPQVLASTVSSVKTFLFAGQDTTSTVIQWMAYELSKSYPSSPSYSDRYRKIREQLCAEHDAVFGASDPLNVLDKMSSGEMNMEETLGNKLPYTMAFIKETLRLHPPAATARLIPFAGDESPEGIVKPMFVTLPAWTHSKTGEYHEAREIQVDGLRIYNCHYAIHRNRNVWGPDAADFNPSRFLELNKQGVLHDEREDTAHSAGQNVKQDATDLPHPYHISLLPQGSYRPFERGPRTCIGTNLAYMEAKIVLCTIARGFEWIKKGPEGTITGENFKWDQRTEKDRKEHSWEREVWGALAVTRVPSDGMRMKVKLRNV